MKAAVEKRTLVRNPGAGAAGFSCSRSRKRVSVTEGDDGKLRSQPGCRTTMTAEEQITRQGVAKGVFCDSGEKWLVFS